MLTSLHDRNETLFYKIVRCARTNKQHRAKIAPREIPAKTICDTSRLTRLSMAPASP